MATKWIDKVIDISMVSDRAINIVMLIQGIIISVISAYPQQCGLDDSQKYDFYDTLKLEGRKL